MTIRIKALSAFLFFKFYLNLNFSTNYYRSGYLKRMGTKMGGQFQRFTSRL